MRTKTLFSILLTALSLHIQAQTWLTNGLVAYYPFNGNANDASGNGNDGTVNGATLTTDRFGYANHAYLFGGTDAHITAPLSSSVFTNDFTTSIWFDAYDISDGWPTLIYEENTSFGFEIVGNASGRGFGIGDLFGWSSLPSPATASWTLESPHQIPIGQFCHAVITQSGINVTMYLNGQVAVTNQVVSPASTPGNTLWIGRAPTEDVVGGYVFHGVLDDIRIYNRALLASEVQQLYDLEAPPRVDLIRSVRPSFSHLPVGTNYQLQVSSDMQTWTNQGSPFTATNSSMIYSQYWDVDNWNQLFFRLQVMQ